MPLSKGRVASLPFKKSRSELAFQQPARPAVLLLHGFMGAASDWRAVVAALEVQYRCLAVDLPGHGRSVGLAREAYTMAGAAKGLVKVLDEAGLERCAIVGYSMGGRLALYFALAYPERCTRLLLESASPGLEAEAERAARRAEDEGRARRLVEEGLAVFLKNWYHQPLFASLGRQEGLVETLIARRLRNDPHELARSLRGMGTGQQPSLWERLGDLRVSTLALTGALDPKYAGIVRRMGRLNPHVQAVVVSGAGHNVHAEAPALYLNHLNDFLNA